jgi:hypothetical protein
MKGNGVLINIYLPRLTGRNRSVVLGGFGWWCTLGGREVGWVEYTGVDVNVNVDRES